ncbi:unnamed protein product, partial [Laminaria digitata]
AATAFKQAIKFLPKNGTALVSMGFIKSRQGLEKQAIDYFRKATRAEPDLGAAWCQLGIASASRGVDSSAKAALRKCLDNPKSPEDMKEAARELIQQ